MYPIFARLGVKLVTRNMAQGGLGTMHSSMGSGSIYGDDVDLLLWDSGTYHNFLATGVSWANLVWTNGDQFEIYEF